MTLEDVLRGVELIRQHADTQSLNMTGVGVLVLADELQRLRAENERLTKERETRILSPYTSAEGTVGGIGAEMLSLQRALEAERQAREQAERERDEQHDALLVERGLVTLQRAEVARLAGELAEARKAEATASLLADNYRRGLLYIWLRAYTGAESIAHDVLNGKPIPEDSFKKRIDEACVSTQPALSVQADDIEVRLRSMADSVQRGGAGQYADGHLADLLVEAAGTLAKTDKRAFIHLQDEIESREREIATLNRLYGELIRAVIRTFPDETRHETALRYIQQAEGTWLTGPSSAEARGLQEAPPQTCEKGRERICACGHSENRHALTKMRPCAACQCAHFYTPAPPKEGQ